MTINKAIIGASYDNSGNLNQVLQKIEQQALKEKLKSGRSQHNLYRSIDDDNSSKFNYSIHGIPIIAYGLMNFYHSDIERVAVVGNKTTQIIFENFVDYFAVNNNDQRFVFVPEGKQWSLENTMRKGKQGIEITDEEMTIFCSGDLPLGSEIEKFRTDPDLENYAAVFNLNSMENIYGTNFNDKKRVNGSMIGPYRRWHLPLKDKENKNDIHWIKENNLWMFKIDEDFLHKVNIVYSGRKQYDDNPSSKKQKGGRWNTIKELALKHGKWYQLIKEIPEVFPYLLVRGTTSYNPALISFDTLSILTSIGLEKEVKVKATHSDFGFLNDIDSVEDIIFNELMLRSVDPNSLYPHWNQLKEFSQYLRKAELPIVNKFSQYMNDWFDNFSNLTNNKMFNSNGDFQETDLSKSMQNNVDLVVNNYQNSSQYKMINENLNNSEIKIICDNHSISEIESPYQNKNISVITNN